LYLKKKKTIAYARISTQEQADTDLGIAAQLTAIENKFGMLDDIFIDENVSGDSLLTDRKGLTAAMATLQRGDRLVVRDWSRLSGWLNLFCWLKMELEQSKRVTLMDCQGLLQGPCNNTTQQTFSASNREARKWKYMNSPASMNART
jgi:DNA invertase Pin-like site-specific DNA recombinase